MLEWVHFQNFQSITDETFPLQPLTVLVGPKGSGKTSVLEGTMPLLRPGALYSFTQVCKWTHRASRPSIT